MKDISFVSAWLGALGRSIEGMTSSQKEQLFYHCGRNCADTGVKDAYLTLFYECQKDLNAFFEALNSWNYVGGAVIEANHIYEVIFKGGCMCDLYTQGYIKEPWLCECSKQSFKYVMETLLGNSDFSIEPICTVLNGAQECRFRITLGK